MKLTPQKPCPGLFITFEGPEGSGKSTQCHQLARWLKKQGYTVVITREPGGTPMAEAIRGLLLGQPQSSKRSREVITPLCETALILAARSQHITHVILPALRQNTIVLCDRFFDSTLAYQGYGRGLNIRDLLRFNAFVTSGLEPHLTFLLDLPVRVGLKRRKKTRRQNRLDQESLAFHERVRRGFLTLARRNPSRWRILDGRCPPEQLGLEILTLAQPYFSPLSSQKPREASKTFEYPSGQRGRRR